MLGDQGGPGPGSPRPARTGCGSDAGRRRRGPSATARGRGRSGRGRRRRSRAGGGGRREGDVHGSTGLTKGDEGATDRVCVRVDEGRFGCERGQSAHLRRLRPPPPTRRFVLSGTQGASETLRDSSEPWELFGLFGTLRKADSHCETVSLAPAPPRIRLGPGLRIGTQIRTTLLVLDAEPLPASADSPAGCGSSTPTSRRWPSGCRAQEHTAGLGLHLARGAPRLARRGSPAALGAHGERGRRPPHVPNSPSPARW